MFVSELMIHVNLSRCRMYFGFINNFLTSLFVDFVVESIHEFKMFIEVRCKICDNIFY